MECIFFVNLQNINLILYNPLLKIDQIKTIKIESNTQRDFSFCVILFIQFVFFFLTRNRPISCSLFETLFFCFELSTFLGILLSLQVFYFNLYGGRNIENRISNREIENRPFCCSLKTTYHNVEKVHYSCRTGGFSSYLPIHTTKKQGRF